MSAIASFPPLVDANSRSLILGSIPGVASLQAQRYYAHPRNQFWRIIGELLGFDANLEYAAKVAALLDAKIALWDVVKTCHRPGSLDAAIDKPSIVANDFASLFRKYPAIERVFFNGATAEQTYRKLVQPTLPDALQLNLQRLPSTSPAHASSNFRQKLQCWQVVVCDRQT